MLWKRADGSYCHRLLRTQSSAPPSRNIPPAHLAPILRRSSRTRSSLGSFSLPEFRTSCPPLGSVAAPQPAVPAPYSPSPVTPRSHAPPRTAHLGRALTERNRRSPPRSARPWPRLSRRERSLPSPALPPRDGQNADAGSARSRRGQAADRRPAPGRPQP